jgi:hypothetical protein
MGRLLRGVVTASMTIAACLVVAAPAQAAQADITVWDVSAISSTTLSLSGEVTCAGPTGSATVLAFATQYEPRLSFGGGSASVPCADGPVPWEITAYSGMGWDSNHSVTVNASMLDGTGASDHVTVVFGI